MTGAGTSRDGEEPLVLEGRHELRWRPSSSLPGTGGNFRTLVVRTSPTS